MRTLSRALAVRNHARPPQGPVPSFQNSILKSRNRKPKPGIQKLSRKQNLSRSLTVRTLSRSLTVRTISRPLTVRTLNRAHP